MAKYTFICEHDEFGNAIKNVTEFRADTLNNVLENFELFLRGSGFYFRGVLDIVEDDVPTSDFDEELEDDGSAFEQVVKSHMQYLESRSMPPAPKPTCGVCGLSVNAMKGVKCYDPACPKDCVENAY